MLNRSDQTIPGPCCLGLAFAALTYWSWNKWADPLVDFGRELYTPWRLAEGQVLTQDIATLFGPASQYFNACCFDWFGTGLLTLTVCNLLILAVLTAVLYVLVSQLCDRATATVACLAQLIIFSFSQYVLESNYNFVAPYAHEATHGLVLNVAMIASFTQYLRRPRLLTPAQQWSPRRRCVVGISRRESRGMVGPFAAPGSIGWLLVSGLCGGLATLTKFEMALTAVLTAALGFLLLMRHRQLFGRSVSALALFAAGAVLPMVAFSGMFLTKMSPANALAATLGAWTWAGSSNALQLEFYQRVGGFDRPWHNLARLLIILAGYLAVGVTLWLLDRGLSRHRQRGPFLPGLLAMTIGLLAFCLCPWWDVARPLPVLAAASAAYWIVQSWNGDSPTAPAARSIPLAMWSVAATILLVKIALWTRLMHYGFCLSLPATVVLVMWMMHHIPSYLARQPEHGGLFRLGAAALLVAAMAAHWQRAQSIYAHKSTLICTAHEQLYALDPMMDPRVMLVQQTLTFLEDQLRPTDTLAVVPEGVMLNFLTRHVNPTPFINYMPPEMEVFGEAQILTAWQQHPPDWVVRWPKDSEEYGIGPFGHDTANGQILWEWILAHYEPITTLESPEGTAVEIFGRREAGGDLAAPRA